MNILVHICCGPCSITVLKGFAQAGHGLCGFFFNPNIQPLAEYMLRREGAAEVAARMDVPIKFADALPPDAQAWDDPWLERTSPAFPEKQLHSRPAPSFPPAVNPRIWLRAVVGREDERCLFCWRSRLRKTAEVAAAEGFDGFSTSLLYSRYQDHERIRMLGESIAADTDIAFVYEDFRPSWQEGIRISKEWGVYRQQYCGCIFSEYDRYYRNFQRL